MLARIVISGVAIVAAALLVPGIDVRWGGDPARAALTLGLLAVIFGVVNGYVRPILRLMSLPLSLLTLGLSSFILNAALFLLVAWVADALVDPAPLRVGGFPPDLDAQALAAAVIGSVVVSAVSTVMAVLTPDT
jgi:putative membrane protein